MKTAQPKLSNLPDRFIWLGSMLVGLFLAPLVVAQDSIVLTKKNCVRDTPVMIKAEDEIWLISARRSHLAPCDLSLFCCCRLEDSDWVPSDISELVNCHATDKSRATVVFAHGNRTNYSWAKSRGLQFYQSALESPGCPRPPVRFVIFAWKSEAELARPRADFKIKARRSVDLGRSFGQFLEQFDDRNMLIGGFSLGGQVVLSGLSSACLDESTPPKGKYRVALFAPVFHSDFSDGGLFRYSLNRSVAETVVFVSRKDKAVRIGGRIERRNNRRSGSTMSQLTKLVNQGENAIQICDITRDVGFRHSVVKYASSPSLKGGMLALLNQVYLDSSRPVLTPTLEEGQLDLQEDLPRDPTRINAALAE